MVYESCFSDSSKYNSSYPFLLNIFWKSDKAWKNPRNYSLVFYDKNCSSLFENEKIIWHLIFYVALHDLDLSKVKAEKVDKKIEAKDNILINFSLYILSYFISPQLFSYHTTPYNVNYLLKTLALLTSLY